MPPDRPPTAGGAPNAQNPPHNPLNTNNPVPNARPMTSSGLRPGTSHQSQAQYQANSHYHYQNENAYYRPQQYTADYSEDGYTQEGEMIDLDSRGPSAAGYADGEGQHDGGPSYGQGRMYSAAQGMSQVHDQNHMGGGMAIHMMHGDEEDEEEDSDEDVFAFVPPSTAEQVAEREYHARLAAQQGQASSSSQQPQPHDQSYYDQQQAYYQQQQQYYAQQQHAQQAQQAYYQQQPYASFTAASTAMSAADSLLSLSPPPSTSGSSPFGFSAPSPEPPQTAASLEVPAARGFLPAAAPAMARPPPSRRGLGTSAGGAPAFGFGRGAGAAGGGIATRGIPELASNNPYAALPVSSSASASGPSTGPPVTPVTPSFGGVLPPAVTNQAAAPAPAFTSVYPTEPQARARTPELPRPAYAHPPSPPSPSTDTDSHPGTSAGLVGSGSNGPPSGMFKLKRMHGGKSDGQAQMALPEEEEERTSMDVGAGGARAGTAEGEEGEGATDHVRPVFSGFPVSASSTLVAKDDGGGTGRAAAETDGEGSSAGNTNNRTSSQAPSQRTKPSLPVIGSAGYDVDAEAQVLPYVGTGDGKKYAHGHGRAHAEAEPERVAGALIDMADGGLRRRNVNAQPYYAYAALANATGYGPYAGRAIGGAGDLDAPRGNTTHSHRPGTAASSNVDSAQHTGRNSIATAANAMRARAAQVMGRRRAEKKKIKNRTSARINTATTDKGGDGDVDGDTTDLDDGGSMNKEPLADDKAASRISVASSSRSRMNKPAPRRPHTAATTDADHTDAPSERGYTGDSRGWTAYSGETDGGNTGYPDAQTRRRHPRPRAQQQDTDGDYTEGEYDRYASRNSDTYDDEDYDDDDGDGYGDDRAYAEDGSGHARGRTDGGARPAEYLDSDYIGPVHEEDEDAGSIKMEFDFDAIDEEDSPFPEVRASVSNIDDPDMPAMTVRMWFVGLTLCMTSSALNVFFNFRSPAPTIVPLALLLVSYPFGKLLAFTLPITTYRIPMPHLPSFFLPTLLPTFAPFRLIVNLLRPLTYPRSVEFSLNPGPWNIKEHVLVFIMANVATGNPYALNAIVVSEHYYKIVMGYWFSTTFVLATQLTGFGLAGLCRRFLVWPASMVWPQNLVACTLLNTLHAEDDDDGIGMYGGTYEPGSKGMSRYRFFVITTIGSFIFFFLPGYLFEALSVFSFICWAAPENIPINQLFGVQSGLGMSILTFDWTQISWIGSPLMVPWWAEVQVFIGFILFYWIMVPVLYYTNSWDLAYFPISANEPYDRFGNSYNVTRILTRNDTFNEDAYNAYSPLYLPATYAMTYLLAFALSTCVIVHTLLYHGRTLMNGFRKIRVEADDIHAKLMRNYPEVPDWWYLIAFSVYFALAIISVEVWNTNVPVWALLLSIMLPIVYVLPSGFIFAMTGQGITLNILAQIIPGTLLPGKPLANMLFKAYSVQTLAAATSFVQDLKLGHYVKVPPRATFMVQMVATLLAAFVQVGVKEWIFTHVQDICDPNQASQLTCPHNQVFFTASAVWGLIGPTRQFGTGTVYHPHLYAIVVGVFLPIPFFLWQRRFPKSWIRYVSTPVILNGVGSIPPATGINYSSWFAVGFVFQYLIRKRNFAWWSKFNYVLSSALDSGTVIAVMVIFFCLQFPAGGSIEVNWWGNSVYRNTADYNRTPLLTPPEGGIVWGTFTSAASIAAPTATAT